MELELIEHKSRGAVISDCGLYRYRLSRYWDMGGRPPRAVLWVMLNPSTADGLIDDPTIRRCKSFADSWGYNSILVGNLYAYRSTDPAALAKADDPVGPENTQHLRVMSEEASITVVAWGAYKARGDDIQRALSALKYRPIYCLGRTKHGAPRHPLYINGLQAREEFDFRQGDETTEARRRKAVESPKVPSVIKVKQKQKPRSPWAIPRSIFCQIVNPRPGDKS